ncbi:peptidase M15 [Dysgonomonas sp. 216]|uniref:D-Ala-D-Ala carboxypeptidase family metallohydrolase n=1 Tax=Dysgonomonas sp. 216 TaxID=2302934 RepID=UPI0013D1D514|nr:D-Ala-D-Ala carboxypeptidase family metallohydrolase [Dysgonomonas sp. 216]NDW19818.1 peptidase M15 [Dysgonomonas sp. 216]
MKLTNNFTLEELKHSNKAKAKGIINEPNDAQIEELRKLCVRLLQPLRDIYGEPMIVSSGFRNNEVNRLVKGAGTSQHMKGQAADIKVNNPRNLLKALLTSGLIFDQAILYQDGKNNFLHLSYNSANNRRQILYSKNTKP